MINYLEIEKADILNLILRSVQQEGISEDGSCLDVYLKHLISMHHFGIDRRGETSFFLSQLIYTFYTINNVSTFPYFLFEKKTKMRLLGFLSWNSDSIFV